MKFLVPNQLTSIFSLLIFTSLLCSCSMEDTATTENDLLTADLKAEKLENLEDQLKFVRQSTMKFHSFEQAAKAGYAEDLPFNPSPYVPQMGYHYINVGLMDGVFEMDKPEILLYVPNEDGELKLVGLEYAVPIAASPEAPEGFMGEQDHWVENPNVAGGAWTLHVWMPLENPDGIFAEFNPNVPLSDPSL
ncbi:MAG: hypothetical protein ABGW97_13055 [Christiangramia sp.]|uniref:hypothetical protein n=1 Tax=Christiangramia sp. TaxID=1931228 RepID=UPI003241FE19